MATIAQVLPSQHVGSLGYTPKATYKNENRTIDSSKDRTSTNVCWVGKQEQGSSQDHSPDQSTHPQTPINPPSTDISPFTPPFPLKLAKPSSSPNPPIQQNMAAAAPPNSTWRFGASWFCRLFVLGCTIWLLTRVLIAVPSLQNGDANDVTPVPEDTEKISIYIQDRRVIGVRPQFFHFILLFPPL